MVKKYYHNDDKNQALDDWTNLSIRQIACIRCTQQNFWVVSDQDHKLTVSFEG